MATRETDGRDGGGRLIGAAEVADSYRQLLEVYRRKSIPAELLHRAKPIPAASWDLDEGYHAGLAQLADSCRARLGAASIPAAQPALPAATPEGYRAALARLADSYRAGLERDIAATRNVHDEPGRATGPDLSMFGRAVVGAVRDRVTMETLLDARVPLATREGIGKLLARAPSPGWRQAARSEWEAERRYTALFAAMLDAEQPGKLLRLGKRVVGRNQPAMTLPALQRDQWIWQRARGHFTSRVRRQERSATPRRAAPDCGAGTASMGAIEELVTLPKDNAELMRLLGEATDEVLSDLTPDDRDKIEAAFRRTLRAHTSE
jgi:hypothetical protein